VVDQEEPPKKKETDKNMESKLSELQDMISKEKPSSDRMTRLTE
jgi:hypothetical protein